MVSDGTQHESTPIVETGDAEPSKGQNRTIRGKGEQRTYDVPTRKKRKIHWLSSQNNHF